MTKKVISNISFLPFLFYLTLEASFPSFISDADWIIYGNKNSLLNWNKTLHSVAILKNEINSVITQTQSFTKSVLTSRANKNIISIGNCPPNKWEKKSRPFWWSVCWEISGLGSAFILCKTLFPNSLLIEIRVSHNDMFSIRWNNT